MGIYPSIRPLLFRLDPERAHRWVFRYVGLAARLPGFAAAERALFGYEHRALHTSLWGRELSNPLGLAAGFDKDGRLIAPLVGLGFGHIELGAVTPRPQPGNPLPRIFRLPADEALINRMGFNNMGAAALAQRLAAWRRRESPGVSALVGVNMGKNRDTPLERAGEDYLACLRALHEVADYLVINVSSPNTPGLRSLQDRASLERALGPVCAERDALARQTGRRVPLLIKLAPDLAPAELEDLAGVARGAGLDGLVAVNTTLGREGLRSPRRGEEGGLSGRPLFARAVAAVSALHRGAGGALPVIGVGGVFSAEDAYTLIRAGATLVQLYTALIYRGPGLVKEIRRGLVDLLERDGFARLGEAVGTLRPNGLP